MKQVRIDKVLESAGIPVRERGTNVGREHINIQCPWCGEVRFHCGIHRTQGWWKCWVCGEKGQWPKLRKKLEERIQTVDWKEVTFEGSPLWLEEKIPEKLFSFVRPLVSYDDMDYRDLRIWDYCINVRKLAPEMVSFAKPLVGIGKWKGYIAFFCRGRLSGRNMGGVEGPRWKQISLWKESAGWGWDGLSEGLAKWIVVTEGIFSALHCPMGRTVAMLGANTRNQFVPALCKNIEFQSGTIVLALDRGIGSRVWDALELDLRECGFEVKRFPWEKFDKKNEDIEDLAVQVGRVYLEEVLWDLVESG